MSAKIITIIALSAVLLSGCGQKAEIKAPKQNAPQQNVSVPASSIEDQTDAVVPPPPPPPAAPAPAQMK